MFRCSYITIFGAEVASNGTVKDLHHKGKERPRQGGIPPTLGRLVADKRMLSLDFEILRANKKKSRSDNV